MPIFDVDIDYVEFLAGRRTPRVFRTSVRCTDEPSAETGALRELRALQLDTEIPWIPEILAVTASRVDWVWPGTTDEAVARLDAIDELDGELFTDELELTATRHLEGIRERERRVLTPRKRQLVRAELEWRRRKAIVLAAQRAFGESVGDDRSGTDLFSPRK